MTHAADPSRDAGRLIADAVANGEPAARLAERLSAALGASVSEAEACRCLEGLAPSGTAEPVELESEPLFAAWVEAAVRLERGDLIASAMVQPPRERSRVKLLKRAAHVLRSHAVAVPESDSPRHATLAPRASASADQGARAWVTAPDGSGGWLAAILAEVRGGSATAFLEAVFRDDTLVRLEGAALTRKGGRNVARDLRAAWGEAIVEIPASAGAAAVLAAEQGGRLERPSLKGAIAEHRSLLRELARDARPLVEPELDGPSARRRVAESAQLLASPLFASWYPDRAALLACQERLRVAASSDLVLNDAQRTEQLDEAFQRAARDFLAAATRDALTTRLRGMSRFLLASGRRDDAERAWACASELDGGGTPPLVDAMFRRAFQPEHPADRGEAPSREPGASGSGLILPGSSGFGSGSGGTGGGLILP